MSQSLTKVVVSLHRSKYRGTCLLVEFVECLARSDEVLKTALTSVFWLQVPVAARSWKFESSPGHHSLRQTMLGLKA